MSIRLATKLANKSSFQYQIGAVIVKGGSILGVGYNKTNRYNSRWKAIWPGSVHAEEAAIIDAINKRGHDKLVGATIYVSRVNNSGTTGMACPCSHCKEVLKAFHLKEAIYTTNTGVERIEL